MTKDQIHAAVAVNAYQVSWNTGTGYTISVSRASSPLKGAATGSLSGGAAIYYGDVLEVTYAASTGYSITGKGSTSITVTGNVTKDQIYATASVNAYKVTWDVPANCSIVVKRTSSPLKGAATGQLNNNDAIYYGDTLSVTYTASNGYSLSSQGSTSITVSGNVTKDQIKASAAPKDYTYNIVYKSSNGTSLGSATVTYKYGTTNTITPPAKSGYNTPSAQTVKWDSTSAKTITFTYKPTPLDPRTFSGYVSKSSTYQLGYSARIEYQNRTADSVQIRVVWTASISGKGAYNNYGQWFRATCGSSGTGNVQVVKQGTWGSASSNTRSGTATSGWIKIPLNTTNATTIKLSVYYYQANYNGTDITPSYADNMSCSWEIPIPAY